MMNFPKLPESLSEVSLNPIVSVNSYALVNFQVTGSYYWADAPEHLAELREPHEHLFHLTVAVEVLHDNHEIPEQDLLAFCKQSFPGGNLGGQSCQQMAKDLLVALRDQYGGGRKYQVDVSEDGEMGASVTYQPL